MPYVTDIEIIFQNIRRKAPKIHCLTNPVTMQDVANLLLAAGGSAGRHRTGSRRLWPHGEIIKN